MANRKQLKKNIKNICGELFTDCVALSLCKGTDQEKLQQLMAEILNLHDEYVSRISHTEPGAVKQFYHKLKTEFTEKANDISERIAKV